MGAVPRRRGLLRDRRPRRCRTRQAQGDGRPQVDEAEKHQVLPLTNQSGRGGDRRYHRDRYEYRPGIGALPPAVAPNLRNRGWRMWADLLVPEGDVEGVIAAHGTESGGWCVYLKDGR